MLNPAAVHLKVGSHLGKYRILRELGEGPMAHVYVADDTLLYRQVAIKVLKPELARQRPPEVPLEEEVSSAAVLLHSGIVPLYGSGYDSGCHYFTMALMPGGNLRQAIGQGLSGRQALTIIGQVARALSFAHAKGLNHHSIKPENILFRQDGSAVLADFHAMKVHGFGVGVLAREAPVNPFYSSPEEYQSSGRQFGRADLYSLGIVLYEMLTGQLPFQSTEVGWQHVHTPVPRLPGNRAGYQGLIDKLLAKRPTERFDANQLIQAVNRLLASETVATSAKVTVLPVGDKAKATRKTKTLEPDRETSELRTASPASAPSAAARPHPESTPERRPSSTPDAEELQMPLCREPLTLEAAEGGDGAAAAPEESSCPPAPPRLSPGRQAALAGLLLLAAGGGLFLQLQSGPPPRQATTIEQPLPAAALNEPEAENEVGAQARSDFARAVELARLGQPESAEPLLQKLQRRHPWLPEPYNNLAVLRAAAGRLEEAQHLLKQGLRAHPSYAVLLENLNTIELEKTLAGALPGEAAGNPQLLTLSELPGELSIASLPAAAMATETAAPAAAGPTEAAADLLNRWAKAWSAQDVEGYLSFYGTRFQPPGAGPRPAWEAGRRQALTRPAWIMVALNEIHVSAQGDGRLRVVAMQDYRSNLYRDRTLKGFDLALQGDQWVILGEESLGQVR